MPPLTMTPSRRSVLRGAAWSAPVIAVAAAAPAFTTSPGSTTPEAVAVTPQGWAGADFGSVSVDGVGWLPVAGPGGGGADMGAQSYPLPVPAPPTGFVSAMALVPLGGIWQAASIDALWTFEAEAGKCYSIEVPLTAHHGSTSSLNDGGLRYLRQFIEVRAGMANAPHNLNIGRFVSPRTGQSIDPWFDSHTETSFESPTIAKATFAAEESGNVSISVGIAHEPAALSTDRHHAFVVSTPLVFSCP